MTRPIGPDGLPPKASPLAPHLTAKTADGPRQTVSILSDLSPGRVRLAPAAAARPGRWRWVLPPVLVALVGGGFLLGRQAPEPTTAVPGPATPLAGARPALPTADAPAQMPATPSGAGGGAVIREPSPPPPGPGVPDTAAGPREKVVTHPPARPRPSPPRSTGHTQAKPPGGAPAPQTAHPALARPATPSPGQTAPTRAVERDVDIITAIVK